MSNVIVVGAGLFGATIARALQREGHHVTVYDDSRPMGGSAPSGCLMKPGWFAGLGKPVTVPALDMLEDLYGVQDLQFRVWPGAVPCKVHWIPTGQILNLEDLRVVRKTVLNVGTGSILVRGDDLREEVHEAERIVVAAGWWCKQLVAGLDKLVGKQGVSFRWREDEIKNIIKPWAPYKQSVIFEEEPGWAWGGDGSALKPENWDNERTAQCLNRVAKAHGQGIVVGTQAMGIRPFMKGEKPCLLREVKPGTWVATGGAKNGTVAAGWAAHQLVRRFA